MVSKKNGWEGKIKKKWKEKWSNEQANKKMGTCTSAKEGGIRQPIHR